jgi:hypothetical protein
MAAKENYQLVAEPVELGWDRPGDNEVQAQTRAYLHRQMVKYPNRIQDKTKSDFRGECKRLFKTPKRVFDRVWKEEIARTGAIAWEKRGPKRGPRRGRKN